MGPMKRVRGVHGGSLRQLARALHRWLRIMEDPVWWKDDEEDAPWWYNERALLSLFAGAVWLSKGWAFEEFAAMKRQKGRVKNRRRRGSRGARGDLEYWWPNADTSFVTEANLLLALYD